jgi:hypothetical protein
MAGILRVDTVDMETHGLVVERVEGHRDAVQKRWPTKSVPGRVDTVVISNYPQYLPRSVRIRGIVTGTDHADAQTNLAALKTAIADPDTIDVSFIDNLTQKLVCRCEGFEETDIPPGFTQSGFRVDIRLVAYNPEYVAV